MGDSDAIFSDLQLARQRFVPALPATLASGNCVLSPGTTDAPFISEREKLAGLFPTTIDVKPVTVVSDKAAAASLVRRPLRIGAVLSGGQAPGGHSVLAGIYDYAKSIHPDSVFFGFLDGPRGLFSSEYVEVDDAMMNKYRSMGGFDAIGSGRDKIETPEQFAGAAAVAAKLELDGVCIIGGDDSNTNAALLAEYFATAGSKTRVIGVPKTIDGDLAIPGIIDISFGFDTACKVYSELIGNVCIDALASGCVTVCCRSRGGSDRESSLMFCAFGPLRCRQKVLVLYQTYGYVLW
jgi:diphosphate-dependent phosphofructokinase